MKTVLRVAMAVALLGIPALSGVAGAAEPMSAWQAYYEGIPNAPEPVPAWGTVEYLFAMETGTLPTQPLAPIAVVGAVPREIPEEGTWEYSQAMETGELPSLCGDVPCAKEEFTIIEVGTMRFRLGIDDGGG